MKRNDTQGQAIKVAVITVIINFLLSVFKFLAGLIGHSYAMISDAVHSASDVFSTFVVIVGIKIAGKESDKKHQFGHERYESVAAILLAVVLAVIGIGIGYNGVKNIIDGSYKTLQIPTVLALIASIVSIVVKELMYWYTIIVAKRINSDALKADAWHHRTDSLSSIGSLIGIGGAMLGVPVLDSIACIVICLFIIKASVDIFMGALSKMTDEACDEETESQIKQYILNCEGVLALDVLQTRQFGNRIYVSAEIACDASLSLVSAHDIAENVHKGIEEQFPLVKHIQIHVNPYNADENTSENISEKTSLDELPNNSLKDDEITDNNLNEEKLTDK